MATLFSSTSFVVPGLLPTCAPSLVETSTSTGSGDQLIRERAVACSSASSSPPPASIPPLRSRADDPPALLGAFPRRIEGWRDPLTRDEQFGDHRNPEAHEEGGGPLFFFLILSLFFPPQKNKMEPLCLIAPDTDCVRMCTRVS